MRLYRHVFTRVGASWSIMLDDDVSSLLVLGVVGWEIYRPHSIVLQCLSLFVAAFFAFTVLTRLVTTLKLSPTKQAELMAYVAAQRTRWPTAKRTPASEVGVSSGIQTAAARASTTARLHILAIVTAVPLVAFLSWRNFTDVFQNANSLRAAVGIVGCSALTFGISTVFIRTSRNRAADVVDALRYRVRQGLAEEHIQPTFEIIESYASIPMLRRFTIDDALELAKDLRKARDGAPSAP